MKWRMHERSLFALLLRAPWWASLLIALGLAALARAALPAPYVPPAVLGTLPFVVIALIAAWRQWRAPSAAQVDAALAEVGTMNWRDFAARVQQAYERQGCTVRPLTGEAADFLLECPGQRRLLACRRWKAATHGVEALRALQAACAREGARGVYLSLGPVSEAAARYAQEADIELLHGPALALRLLK